VTADEDRIRDMIRSSAWLMRVLRAVHRAALPDAWVGAGVLRDLVWGELYGPGFTPGQVHDVDVAFFDPADLSRRRDEQATARLLAEGPGLPWQARNQAAVHTWYSGKFGGEPVAPLLPVADAVATWPETATAVAVRLEPRGGTGSGIEICAPLGLGDEPFHPSIPAQSRWAVMGRMKRLTLLGGVWRRNARRASLDVSLARLARHQPARRWPGVRVIPPS
jgi:uncharacterized protein